MILKQFKIYPDNHWVWIEVFIHHSQKAMVKFVDDPALKDFHGLSRGGYTVKIHKNGSESLTGQIGELHFHRGAMGAGTVSHESTHATFRYFQHRLRFKLKPMSKKSGRDVSSWEENFCWVLGNIANQIYRHYWGKRKQIKPQFKCWFPPIPRKRQFPDGKGMI
jgi:hypothetical protein